MPGRSYLAVLVLYLVFVLYGSLSPLEVRWIGLGRAWRQFENMPTSYSRGDIVANLALYALVGFLAMGAATKENLRRRWWAIGPVVVAAAAAFSAAVEFAQIYVPWRQTSFNDIVAAAAGAAAGVVAWRLFGRHVTDRIRGGWQTYVRHPLPGRIFVLYMAALAMLALLPFDATIRPTELYHKLRDGWVNLVPFADPIPPQGLAVHVLLMVAKAVAMVPWGLMLALALGRRPRRTWTVGVCALGFLAVVELIQVFVRSRYASSTDVILGGFGAVAGAMLAGLFPDTRAGRRKPRRAARSSERSG